MNERSRKEDLNTKQLYIRLFSLNTKSSRMIYLEINIKKMFKPRQYQTEIALHAYNILQKYKIVMLAMSVRTGKSHTALITAQKY